MTTMNSATQFAFLLGDVYRAWRTHMDIASKKYNFTRTEWQILGKLFCHGPQLTQADLGYLVGLDNAQLTRTLNELEKKGLIEKTMDRTDKRGRHIKLLDPNAEYLQVMTDVSHQIKKAIAKELSTQEQKELIQLMEKVKKVVVNLEINI